VSTCYFVSDLHGRERRYEKLFAELVTSPPSALFIGGDIFPSGTMLPTALEHTYEDFIQEYLVPQFERVRVSLGKRYPRIFVILGNDDGRLYEPAMIEAAESGLWEYAHGRQVQFENYVIFGYSYVPPTPFLLKDWERYDVSRYVDPGCVSPEEGWRTVPVTPQEAKYSTIQEDLAKLGADVAFENSVCLFHSPPHKTNLDRADLDGKKIDHVPLDPHVGSIAIRKFIETHQPLVTLHGHIHESARLTGSWRDQIGRTHLMSAAHDGPELALVQFDSEAPSEAVRRLI